MEISNVQTLGDTRRPRKFQIQIWSQSKMTLEISKAKISVSVIQTTMEIYVA